MPPAIGERPFHTAERATEQLVAIGDTPEHRKLLECAAADGIDTCTCRKYLWSIRAPRELPQLPRISARIRRVLCLCMSVWKLDLSEFEMDRWPPVLDYIVENATRLAREIGGGLHRPVTCSGETRFPGRYLTYWAPYPTYWNDHPSLDDRYALLQAHLLVSSSLDIRRYTLLSEYEGCTAKYFKLKRDPYRAAYAVRILSRGSRRGIEMLKALPVEERPFTFARLMRGLRVEE